MPRACALQDYGVSLADMQDQGVVMQFQYPDKITGGTCYPMVTMDLSKFGKDNIQIATKYHFRGCPDTGDTAVPGSDSNADSATCDEHMVTVLSAQVTTACCPPMDPNCGIPATCSARCAGVFNNFFTSCQSFIDGPELDAFHAKCQAAVPGH